MRYFVVLSGCGYDVTVVDRQVIFTEAIPIFGCSCQFAMERPVDINETPGIWYFCGLWSSSDRVPASHIVQAAAWCDREFGASFQPYSGALAT